MSEQCPDVIQLTRTDLLDVLDFYESTMNAALDANDQERGFRIGCAWHAFADMYPALYDAMEERNR